MSKQKASIEELWEDYKISRSVWKTAERFGMGGQSVHERLKKNGFKLYGEKFRPEEDAVITAAYKNSKNIRDLNLKKLAEELGRPTHTNVCRRARQLGLTMRNRRHTVEQIDAQSKRVLLKVQNGQGHRKYEHVKSGWREYSGGKRYFLRSNWEMLYADHLERLLLVDKVIKKWEYEPDTFWFESIKRGVRSYTPDFKITHLNNVVVYHEVKGWLDPKSKTKLSRMKKYYPEVEMILVMKEQMKEMGLL